MDPEPVATLQLVKGPIGVVSIRGRARQGKSYILNQVLFDFLPFLEFQGSISLSCLDIGKNLFFLQVVVIVDTFVVCEQQFGLVGFLVFYQGVSGMMECFAL